MSALDEPRTSTLGERIAALSPAKRALLELRLRNKQAFSDPVVPQITSRTSSPASFAQQRLWFLDRLYGGSPGYHLPGALDLSGILQLQALERAVNAMVERHESLRTHFVEVDGVPLQVVTPSPKIPLALEDFSGLEMEAKNAAVTAALRGELESPFDLNQGPLLRMKLLRLGRQEHILLWNFHHIISDGWSMAVFKQELAELYNAFCEGGSSPLAPLPMQHSDYAAWQRQWLQGAELERQLVYWRKQLADLSTLELPADCPRPARLTYVGARHNFAISPTISSRLGEFNRREKTTPFMSLLAAFQVLLARYSGQKDISVGTAITTRQKMEFEHLIGLLVNTLVIRTRLTDDASFRAVLAQVRNTVLEAYEHQDLPFEKLVEDLNPERDPSRHPLFQVLFAFQNTPEQPLRLTGLEASPHLLPTNSTRFDLELQIWPDEESWNGSWLYNTDLFASATIVRLAGHYLALLEALLVEPERPIFQVPMLATPERYQMLVEWNRTARDYPRDKCIHQLFEEQVARAPEAVAVMFEGEKLTYCQLNVRANQLAHHLQNQGVRPETLVGLCVERSLAMVVGLLGILKAGGAYVPLDPTLPLERLAFMVEDAGVPVLIAQRGLAAHLSSLHTRLVWLDEMVGSEDFENPLPVCNSSALAYVIYTSGSTGQPKGVEISHKSLVNCVCHFAGSLNLRPHDAWLAITTLSFDIAGLEIWLPLLVGARVIIATRAMAQDGQLLSQTLLLAGATVLQATPATWQGLLQSGWQANPRLKILCGGEAMPQELADRLTVMGQHAWNCYGPTETTIYSTTQKLIAGRRVSIGVPLANTRVYILDACGQPVPVGVVGQLFIGGDGVARGYHHRPKLTAEKFVADPFSNDADARLYCTGDLARWLPDGNVEFLGRRDSQVKIRGFRIELGEIEAVLSAHPALIHGAVLAKPDASRQLSLTAYVVLRELSELSVGVLRAWLNTKLPDYMIPARFVRLPCLPLNANGKLDRQALAALHGTELAVAIGYAAPQNEYERKLAAIWQAALRRELIGIHDNFFHLGGHSLLAVMVLSQIKQQFKVDVPLRWMFEHPTIEKLAVQLAAISGQREATPAIHLANRQAPLPMSFAQQGMWLLHQTLADSAAYNLPFAWHLAGPVDADRFRQALQQISARHEILRTALVLQGEDLIQLVVPAGAFVVPWQECDLQAVESAKQPSVLAAALSAEARRPFDLAQAPLWRVLWIKLAAAQQVLALNFDHSIVDEWSMRLLVEELEKLYATNGNGEAAGLPELTIQYADYAAWQRQQLTGAVLASHQQYWREQLRDLPASLQLPGDLPRKHPPDGSGERHQFELDGQLVAGLRTLALEADTTLFAVMLAAYYVWLYRYTDQTDIIVGTPLTRRELPEVQSLLGLFLNTLPIRVRLDVNLGFREVVRQVRETLLAAFSHADLPFEQMVELTCPDRENRQQPLYQEMFVLLEEDLRIFHLGQAESRPVAMSTRTSKCELTLSILAKGPRWACTLEYPGDLFTAATVGRMAGHWQELLRSFTATPEAPICRLNLLSAIERQQLLVEWNRTERDYPRDQCIHRLFEEQVARTPEGVAVVFEGNSLTYRELNLRANQVACQLQVLGVGLGDFVGLMMERSLEMIVGILGVLKAGGVYWALEENLPEERVQLQLAETKPRALLVHNQAPDDWLRLTGQRSADSPGLPNILSLDDLFKSAPEEPALNRLNSLATHPAYLTYTSGSTGRPKGVLVSHRGVVRLVKGTDYVSLGSSDALLHLSPLSFDASTFEIWGALLNGGRLILLRPGPPTLAEIGEAIHRHGVTTLWLTAGLFHLMVNERIEDLRPLQQLLAGGDVLAPEQVRKARRELPQCRIINGYGPTENTTFTCCYLVSDEAALLPSVPIGRPIANTQVYVLDPNLLPVPVGVAGELFAGGDGVACGYLNQPELTAERFIPDPFSHAGNGRLYRTGDQVRWRPDGNLEFLGRLDSQVKIRGFRIELGEIEAGLRAHPAIREALVVPRADLLGEKLLVGYLVATEDQKPDDSLLREHLARTLPAYMLPQAFVWLDQLPLNANGKVDRNQLPPPEVGESACPAATGEPLNLLELELTQIWQRLLGRQMIGRSDNFFALGGHSLLAARMAAEIEKSFASKLTIGALFQSPTIQLLAQRLTDEAWAPPWSSLVPLQPQGSKPPLFLIHGWGGSVLELLALARLLPPDQPCYGIQAVGLDGRAARHTTVEEMAAHYVTEIVSFQPRGQIYLGAYCMGGVIAFETARQLQQQGRRVALLALVDTYPTGRVPFGFWSLMLVPRFLAHLRRFSQLPVLELYGYLKQRCKSLMYLFNQNRSHAVPMITIPDQTVENPKIAGFGDYYHAVASRYQLRPYYGPGDVFVGKYTKRPLRWYWRYLIRGGVAFHPISGEHLELIRPSEHLSKLAQSLTNVLDKRQQAEAAQNVRR